jgi:hypothetical protein
MARKDEGSNFMEQVQADTVKNYSGGIEIPQYGNDLKPKPNPIAMTPEDQSAFDEGVAQQSEVDVAKKPSFDVNNVYQYLNDMLMQDDLNSTLPKNIRAGLVDVMAHITRQKLKGK